MSFCIICNISPSFEPQKIGETRKEKKNQGKVYIIGFSSLAYNGGGGGEGWG